MRALVLTHNTFALAMPLECTLNTTCLRVTQGLAESLARQLEAIAIEVSALTAQLASQHLKSHLSDSRKGALRWRLCLHHTTVVSAA